MALDQAVQEVGLDGGTTPSHLGSLDHRRLMPGWWQKMFFRMSLDVLHILGLPGQFPDVMIMIAGDIYDFTIEQIDNNSFRTFSSIESSTFDQQAQAVLIELVNLNILTPTQREIIIDKALALDIAPINQEQMKWVVLMVLFNMPDSAGSFTWIQDLLYQEFPTIH